MGVLEVERRREGRKAGAAEEGGDERGVCGGDLEGSGGGREGKRVCGVECVGDEEVGEAKASQALVQVSTSTTSVRLSPSLTLPPPPPPPPPPP